MEIFQKRQEGRLDSFWYEGNIAQQGSLLLRANGEIKVDFPDGERYRNGQGAVEATLLGWKDEDISKLYKDDKFHSNNWFEVIDLDDDNFMSETIWSGNYDRAIASLVDLVKERKE
jgi:hypothetical protein